MPLFAAFIFMDSNEWGPSLPETQLSRKLTLKIQGWGQRLRSYKGGQKAMYKSLSTTFGKILNFAILKIVYTQHAVEIDW